MTSTNSPSSTRKASRRGCIALHRMPKSKVWATRPINSALREWIGRMKAANKVNEEEIVRFLAWNVVKRMGGSPS